METVRVCLLLIHASRIGVSLSFHALFCRYVRTVFFWRRTILLSFYFLFAGLIISSMALAFRFLPPRVREGRSTCNPYHTVFCFLCPPALQVRREALKHLLLVLRTDKKRLAELILTGSAEVDPVVSRLLKGLLELSTGEKLQKKHTLFRRFLSFGG